MIVLLESILNLKFLIDLISNSKVALMTEKFWMAHDMNISDKEIDKIRMNTVYTRCGMVNFKTLLVYLLSLSVGHISICLSKTGH